MSGRVGKVSVKGQVGTVTTPARLTRPEPAPTVRLAERRRWLMADYKLYSAVDDFPMT